MGGKSNRGSRHVVATDTDHHTKACKKISYFAGHLSDKQDSIKKVATNFPKDREREAMMGTGFSEQAQAYRIGFIASRVYTILDRIEKKRELHSKDMETVSEGAELMSQIVSGSLLVENKGTHDGLTPSLEGISVLGNALSVLKMLGSSVEEGGLSDIFIHFRRCLDKLSKGEATTENDIRTLKKFFEILSKLIMDDFKSEKLSKSSHKLGFSGANLFSPSYAI